MQFKVLPHLEKGAPLFFILVDNLRFDQWKAIQPMFAESFRILKKIVFTVFFQRLPNIAAMQSLPGMLPVDIEKQFPVQWKNDDEQGGKICMKKNFSEHN